MGFETMPQSDGTKDKPKKGILKKVAALAVVGMAMHAVDARTTNFEKKASVKESDAKTQHMSEEDLRGMKEAGLEQIKEKQLYNSAIKMIKEQLAGQGQEISSKPTNSGIEKIAKSAFEQTIETERKAYQKILENKDTRIEYNLEENKIIFHVMVDGQEQEYPFTTLGLFDVDSLEK